MNAIVLHMQCHLRLFIVYIYASIIDSIDIYTIPNPYIIWVHIISCELVVILVWSFSYLVCYQLARIRMSNWVDKIT